MEFFLPSILFLLVACAIVFFVIPRFGPLVLAGVALVLLVLGVYNHYSMFATEYRLSTWQSGMIGYAPYIMVGALVLAIVFYLLYLVPSGSNANSNANYAPSPASPASPIANLFSGKSISLPSPGTATNGLTESIGNAMRKAAEMAKIPVRNQPLGNGRNAGLSPN